MLFITITFGGLLMFASHAVAASIKEITIHGNERVEATTVQSYLGINTGEEYDPVKVRRSLKSLYGTGLFDNVEISWDNGRLIVEIKENPIVNQITFENNDALSIERLESAIALRPRAVFTPGKVQDDVKSILSAYRQTGRFLAQVDPQIIRRDQNRVDVIYVVSEGEKTKIRKIDFVGNKKYSNTDLKKVIGTKESAFWRFLSSADSYDPDRLDFDKELLRRFYIKNGYADFQVMSAIAELSKTKKDFFVTFTLNEGDVYDFGTVDVRLSSRVDVDMEDLRAVVSIKEGNVYDGSRIDKNIDALIDVLGQKGFAFLDVVPVLDKNPETKKVNIAFDVRPGPRVYISRINIKGNTRTQDHVIRREMRFVEGDAFSNSKLQRSKDRLQILDYFQTVGLDRKDADAPDRMDIDVNVVEKSTGAFNIGAGFSSFEGVIGTTDLSERNFLGKGQDLVLSFAMSSQRQDLNFSFTEPWFMGQQISAGIDIFNQRREFQEQSSFDQERVGGAFRMGFPLGEFTKNNVRLGYRKTNISDINAAASQFVVAAKGKRDSLMLSNTVVYDTRDSSLLPTRGSRVQWTAEYSGFGTDTTFIRNNALLSRHFPIADGWVFSSAFRAGHLFDINNKTPLFENFNLGGPDLRGFDRSGIGPRDAITQDALGGKLMAGHTFELRFPIPGIKDAGVNGLLFNDGGIVTDFQANSPAINSADTYRMTAGVGVFWNSPLGPLRFEFGFPIVDEIEDETRVFSFNFGTRF